MRFVPGRRQTDLTAIKTMATELARVSSSMMLPSAPRALLESRRAAISSAELFPRKRAPKHRLNVHEIALLLALGELFDGDASDCSPVARFFFHAPNCSCSRLSHTNVSVLTAESVTSDPLTLAAPPLRRSASYMALTKIWTAWSVRS